MSTVLSLLKNDPDALEKLEIGQILAICGNGKLSDNSTCSIEFRDYLRNAKSDSLFAYAESCLTRAFEKSGQALQDVVNELGRRLDFQVENGVYQGTSNSVGHDGLWSDNEGNVLIIEVKTTDAYRINLDTVAAYQDRLRKAGKIIADQMSSVLLVVGRQDTGDLEAQVRGSRHAWGIRIISVDALKKLVLLKENAESIAIRKIHELLVPFEYTRLDRIIEIAFMVAEETSDALQQEVSPSEPKQGSEDHVAHQVSSGVEINTVRNAILEDLRNEYVPLIKKSRALFWSADESVRVAVTVSKEYPGGDYWYAYHADWDEFLGQGKTSLYVLGCVARGYAFIIPYNWIHSRLDKLHVTDREGRRHYHVSLYPKPGGELVLHLKDGVDEDLTSFKKPLNVSTK